MKLYSPRAGTWVALAALVAVVNSVHAQPPEAPPSHCPCFNANQLVALCGRADSHTCVVLSSQARLLCASPQRFVFAQVFSHGTCNLTQVHLTADPPGPNGNLGPDKDIFDLTDTEVAACFSVFDTVDVELDCFGVGR